MFLTLCYQNNKSTMGRGILGCEDALLWVMLFSKHVVVVNYSYSINQKEEYMNELTQSTIHHWSDVFKIIGDIEKKNI